MTAYCKSGDLLIGDVALGTGTSRDGFIRDAADEMDARIGFVYVLPLVGLQPHALLLLKMINARLASGRLLMSLASVAEDHDVHRYGEWLIKEAYADLSNICNQTINLVGAVAINDPSPVTASIYNHDAESAIDIFEDAFMRQSNISTLPAWWQPGAVN